MEEYIITVHGIATAGKWQDDISTAYAPHFECLTVSNRHYRWLGALKLFKSLILLAGGCRSCSRRS